MHAPNVEYMIVWSGVDEEVIFLLDLLLFVLLDDILTIGDDIAESATECSYRPLRIFVYK